MSGNNITALANQFGFTPALIFNPLSAGGGLDASAQSLLQGVGGLFGAIGDFFNQFASQIQSGGCTGCFPPLSPPSIEDGSQPAGSLTTDGDTITTPGGYQIKMTGQYDWEITGPDGKKTAIEGDPHVREGDGGKWDFKRPSTFVLPDGTRVNVSTVPGGAEGMTVTGQLEVINGNDRVVASDIDKGKGKIGTVTQDGFQHVNGFQGDVFVMGQETDDWSYTGREITGSQNGGESFDLGGELHPLSTRPEPYDAASNLMNSLFGDMLNQWQDNWQPNRLGSNPYSGNDQPAWQDDAASYDREQHQQFLGEAFRALSQMFRALSHFMSLSQQFSNNRRSTPLAV
jgi:hypothetical protein